MTRISIRSIMAFIIVTGVSFAAIHSGSAAWAGTMFSITFFTMVCSLLGVALTRRMRRVYWAGFALLGWSYLILNLAPGLDLKVGRFLLAPPLFRYLADVLHSDPGDGLQSVPVLELSAMATGGGFGGRPGAGLPNLPAFVRIGVAIEALLWAFLGGWVACYFAAHRGSESHPVIAAPSRTEAV